MKLSEIVVGIEYAIIPSWYESSARARDIDHVREDDVVRGVVQSKDKYLYVSGQKKTEPDFQLAPEGERSVGVLVKGQNSHGTDVYWTARLADIVVAYDELTPRWDKEKADRQKQEEEEERRRTIVEAHKTKTYSQVRMAETSMEDTCRELLGENARVSIGTTGRELELTATATLTLTEFQRLLELAYEGLEVRRTA